MCRLALDKMHLHFERNVNAKCDCSILSLSWMGKVPDELPEEEGWKLNRNNYYQEGWLATGNVRGLVGVTFTTSHSRRQHELPLRTNYNLRGHRSEVILVKWNEPYQKLASCDKSGVIFVWIKYEGRWSIELINDRSTPVTHFSWSHDGRMALICYQDGFVLVGSVAGQRYWSSMLTLEARITCGCWTPDDLHVYLGTAAAHLVVMDVHGAMVSQVQLNSEGGITGMAWSCEKFKMEENEEERDASLSSGGGQEAGVAVHVLAVAFSSGDIVFLRGYDDVSPTRAHTGLDGSTLAMEWANSRELLAVAGTLMPDPKTQSQTSFYKNIVKFYSDAGNLLYTAVIPYTQARVSALTWGHAGRRLFVACGGAVQTARVWRVVAPLQLLARVRAAQALSAPAAAARLPLPPRLRPLVASLFAHTIRCCVPEPQSLRWFVSRPPAAPARLHCTMLRHDEEEESGAGAYTLYLEHLGGLVPLLKGRRTSKIRPEFVIFDPQAEDCTVSGRESSSSSGSTSSSSTSSGASGSGSGGGSGGGVPRAPRTPRTPHRTTVRAPPTLSPDTDSSDTEQEEGCSGSPRLQRKKRARERRKHRNTAERERQEAVDELAYIDSLPEDVRLVEVTSNIWGTKFKMHGLATNVPANLGQVTYKTSLLHLQPRQMTLVITEVRDDCPVTPDPNFNPNIFSEDEEDSLQHIENNNSIPSLARAESYEELTYMDTSESIISYSEPVAVRHVPAYATASERRVNATTSVGNRHAISPLRCDTSVPTLQSPKNAVAPTDIIFERPSPQTISCGGGGGRGDFCGGRTEYTVRSDNLMLKSNLEQPSFSLNLGVEPSRHVTIKKNEIHANEGCLSKLRKNMCGKSDSTAYDVNTRLIKSVSNKTYENEVHPDVLNKREDTLRSLQKGDELKFIDEEEAVVSVERVKVQRTTTVVPISPVCAPTSCMLHDNMTRSCSVGYLDLVDPQLLHAGLSIAALRKEEPKRLVLVSTKTRPNKKNDRKQGFRGFGEGRKSDARLSTLKNCRKSKSLDSSELSFTCDKNNPSKTFDNDILAKINNDKDNNNKCVNMENRLNFSPEAGDSEGGGMWTPQPRRRSRRDYPVCTLCNLVSPYDRREVQDVAAYVCVACGSKPPLPIVPDIQRHLLLQCKEAERDSDTDYSKYYSSLEQLALRLRAARECSSAPASPRPTRPTRSSPASPAPRPRRTKRNSSASPIRQLLNSPLLSRRRNKKQPESSDEEQAGGSEASPPSVDGCINGKNYRDLESFQKQQLRNKLKRGKGEWLLGGGGAMGGSEGRGGGGAWPKRQLVMHNKAPMWNENSQVYQLDFGGRVTQESAKNFQIEFHGKQVMQFGRIDGKAYTLDFQYPFSALQAFAVALANVTQRLK